MSEATEKPATQDEAIPPKEKEEGEEEEGQNDSAVEEEEEEVDLSGVPIVRVTVDQTSADVSVDDLSVHSRDDALKKRVANVVQLAMSVLVPLARPPPGSSTTQTSASDEHAAKRPQIKAS